jgi:hypothetical protein
MIKSQRGFTPILILIGILILILVTVGTYYFGTKNSVSQNSQTNSINTPSPQSQNISQDKNVLAVFIRNRELWQLNQNQESKKITDTGSTVFAFDTLTEKNLLVFITEKLINHSSNFTEIEPDTVFLQKIGQPAEKIFELQPKIVDPNFNDYKLQLRDVGFSKDGRFLAITTSDSLWLYDLTTKKQTNVFTKIPDLNKGAVYAYSTPIFSPDNKQLILKRGFYEGSDQILVNLASGDIKELGYQSYVSGQIVIDWLNNQEILVSEYTDVTSQDNISKLKITTLPDQKDQQTFEFEGFASVVVNKNDLYIATRLNKLHENNSFIDNFDSIIRLNLKTGEQKTLYSAKTTGIDGSDKSVRNLKLASDKLLIGFYQAGHTPKGFYNIYSLDISGKTEQPEIKLVQENASLEVVE